MAPSVAAHGPGSSIVSTNGKFVLTPGATANATFHAYLSTLGLPIGPGDVLVWSWSANASMGPAIAFDIHSHVGGYLEYLNVTGDRANNSWSVPGSSDYAVQWTNPNPQSENVTYAFQLVPPPLDLWPLYLLLVAPLLMIGRSFGILDGRNGDRGGNPDSELSNREIARRAHIQRTPSSGSCPGDGPGRRRNEGEDGPTEKPRLEPDPAGANL